MKFAIIAATLAIAAGSVSAVHPTQSCVQTHVAAPGDTCKSLANTYNVKVGDLHRWNHGLESFGNEKCNKLVVGKAYCVHAPRTKAKRCLSEKKKAAAQKKKAAEEAAKKAAEDAKKKADQEAAKKDKPSQPKPTDNGNVKLNKANHIVPNCKKFYTITTEDNGCADVAQKNGIDVEQLYSWNKGLHHKGEHICDNLDTGKAYCVGV
ncbi:hypothetical protein DFQ28_003755 [Apophysomyces sp. BC1034]|nr:hypothetical protein DFQ30_003858 [Apophysomyces sp. BC1015]KAG0178782.1 hypothetical protein DFQ29_003026 [Apophysomyces sp. BC1021]KAG0189176.1 hypothetical protein DFQ28_003755 [Apophysomyces sp. BC1034]